MPIEIEKNIRDRVALGAEEFALVLGLAGRANEGRAILNATHPDQKDLDITEMLTASSHSLLARGLCQISGDDQPVLERRMETVIRPLLDFSEILYLNFVANEEVLELVIHINPARGFCGHWNKNEIVHLMEFGDYRHLHPYLMDALGLVLSEKDPSHPPVQGKIPGNFLEKAIEAAQDSAPVLSMLKEAGWTEEDAGLLAGDTLSRVSRGSLVRVKITPDDPPDAIGTAPRSALFFEIGSKYDWAFQYPPGSQDATGQARIVNRDEFSDMLAELLK
jgi:hypothetical protein